MASRRILTMTDLARLAGVSVSTISRSLAGSDTINDATRDRVVALARQHGYQPNSVARNLRLGRTQAIGVVVPLGHQADAHLIDPFVLALIDHLADALTQRGHDMLLRKVVPQDDGWLDRLVVSGRVDGVIVIGQSDQWAAIERAARDFPALVAWGAGLPDHAHVSVGSDNVLGGALATRHLIERGRRRLFFLGDTSVPEVGQRAAGFRNACDAAGLGARAHAVRIGLSADAARRDLTAILDREADADGIFAACDMIAIAAIGVLKARGRRVPDDVAVVGYDDVPIAAHVVPALTTIRQDPARGAELLVEKLFARIDGGVAASEQMVPRLVVRQSA